MQSASQAARIVFALGMCGLGILGLVHGDFALQWQPVPASVPARQALAYVAAILELAGGIGLLVERTAALSSRLLWVFALLWVVLLKLPGVVKAPLVEVNWLGAGEIGIVLAATWALVATLAVNDDGPRLPFAVGTRGVRIARLLFGLVLIPVGLSHFVYATQTAALVPSWLPMRIGWVYVTGAGHLAASIGVLFSILPTLAAALEGTMLMVFTLAVWGPAIAATPATRLAWTAFVISWVVSGAAWVVAAAIADERSLTAGA